jgi:hypothetical protein
VHLISLIIRIYQDAWSYECQNWGKNVAEVLAREEWNGFHLTLAAAVSVSPCFGSLTVESTLERGTVTLGCC